MNKSQKSNKKSFRKQPLPKERRNILEKYPGLGLTILLLITLVVYFKTFKMNLVDFDDNFFIIRSGEFNKDLGNIWRSFVQSLFPLFDCIYYRPVFRIDMILEYQLFGTNPTGYHVTNLMFHFISVGLLFYFFRKLKTGNLSAFLLSALFAVHPVLSQAVAWIPGRNDMLLMIFMLAGIMVTMNYLESQKWPLYLAQFFLFLVSLFTKETAVVIPAIATLLFVYVLKFDWKIMLTLFIGWAVAISIWYFFRSYALAGKFVTPLSDLTDTILPRFSAILEYTGKIFLPVNLSVFPMIKDVSITWGLIALLILVVLVIVSKSYPDRLTIFGIIWFLVFIFPVLIVPSLTNENLFEHRLYIPLAGILIILSRTFLFNEKLSGKLKLIIFIPIILVFAAISFYRIDYFKDPLVFWTKASEDSPQSFQALFKHASLTDLTTSEEREKFWLMVHAVDTYHPGVQTGLAEICLDRGYYKMAGKLLKTDLRHSKQPVTYYDLARLYAMENKPDSIIPCLNELIKMIPEDRRAYQWLAFIYLDRKEPEQARNMIGLMKKNKIEIPAGLISLTDKADTLRGGREGENETIWLDIRCGAKISLAEMFIKLTEYVIAENYLKQVIRIRPGSQEAYFTLGKLYFDKKDLPQSIKYLAEVIRINPLNAQASNNLADLYFMQNEREKAMKLIDFMKKNKMEISPKLLQH